MAYYNSCPVCGSNLDPGEKCDCEQVRERMLLRLDHQIRVGKGGQYQFDFTKRNEVMKKSLYSVAVIAVMGLMVACSIGAKAVAEEDADTTESVITVAYETEFIPFKAAPLTEIEIISNKMELSFDDEYLLAKICMAEAEGESIEGKAMVIRVVLNRVMDDGFENSIEDVIYERTSNGGWQFAPMQEGGRWYTTEPNEDCYKAVEMVVNGWDESKGALYFERTSTDSTWHSRNLEYLFVVGNHTFYR